MPKFSVASLTHLETCHRDLLLLFMRVIDGWDCAVICGHRGEDSQNEAYTTGKSQRRWPDSLHNKVPSLAVDVVPYPVDWEGIEDFKLFAMYVLGVAAGMGIKIEWGGSWPKFKDYPHYQLKDKI